MGIVEIACADISMVFKALPVWKCESAGVCWVWVMPLCCWSCNILVVAKASVVAVRAESRDELLPGLPLCCDLLSEQSWWEPCCWTCVFNAHFMHAVLHLRCYKILAFVQFFCCCGCRASHCECLWAAFVIDSSLACKCRSQAYDEDILFRMFIDKHHFWCPWGGQGVICEGGHTQGSIQGKGVAVTSVFLSCRCQRNTPNRSVLVDGDACGGI